MYLEYSTVYTDVVPDITENVIAQCGGATHRSLYFNNIYRWGCAARGKESHVNIPCFEAINIVPRKTGQ